MYPLEQMSKGEPSVLFRWTFILFDGSRTVSRRIAVFARFVLETSESRIRDSVLCSPTEKMNNPQTVIGMIRPR